MLTLKKLTELAIEGQEARVAGYATRLTKRYELYNSLRKQGWTDKANETYASILIDKARLEAEEKVLEDLNKQYQGLR